MTIKEVKKLLKIEDVKPQDYTMEDLADKIGSDVTEARIIKGITQKELAEKLNTKQSSIARLENGSSLPSLSFLYKVAKALDTFITPPEFDSVKNHPPVSTTSDVSYVPVDVVDNYTTKTSSIPQYSIISNSGFEYAKQPIQKIKFLNQN